MAAKSVRHTKHSTSGLLATLRHPRFYVNFAALGAVAFFWVVLNPFRILELEIPPLNRAMAALGAYFVYPDRARDKITVLTMNENDEFLRQYGWPLPIDQWRQLLTRLACAGPKAIMVDVLLYKPDVIKGEWRNLLDTVAKIESGKVDCPGRTEAAKPIPVIFARGGPGGRLGSDGVPDRILAVTEWHAESGYPLTVPDENDRGQETAAFALFRRICSGEGRWDACPTTSPPSDGDSIEVFWGLKLPADQAGLLRPLECPSDREAVLRTFGDVFRSIFDHKEHFQHCSYHRRVTVEQMDTVHENCLAMIAQCLAEQRLFSNKVVFIGAHLNNMTDTVYSPIQNGLDGVFLHAMAFDNLLVFGSDYYQSGLIVRLWCWAASLVGLFIACFLGARSDPLRSNFLRGLVLALVCAALLIALLAILICLRLLLPADSEIVFGLILTFLAATGTELKLREVLIRKLEPAGK